MNEMRNETTHETEKNNTSKQRDGRAEKTRRHTGRDNETRDETTLGNEQSAADRENQAHEEKNIKSPHSSPDPLIACSPSSAGLK